MILNLLPHLIVVLAIVYFLHAILVRGSLRLMLTSLLPGMLHWPFLVMLIEKFYDRPFYDDLRYSAMFGGLVVSLFLISNVRNGLKNRDYLPSFWVCLRNAYRLPWWQILFFPAYISFMLMYLGRYEINLAGSQNAHHFFNPMLMVEFGDLRYIHFWTTGVVKPGTSKYVAAFFGWLYLKLASWNGISNLFDPTPYIYAYTFVRGVMAFSFAVVPYGAFLLTKELFGADEKENVGPLWVGFATAFLVSMQSYTINIRDDLFFLLPALMSAWAIVRWNRTDKSKYFWIAVVLAGFSFAYKQYVCVMLLAFIGIVILDHEVPLALLRAQTQRVGGKLLFIAKRVACREAIFVLVVLIMFLPGIMQLILEPETAKMSVQEFQRYMPATMDQDMLPQYAKELGASFFEFLRAGTLRPLRDALNVSEWLPPGWWQSLKVGRWLPLGALSLIALAYFLVVRRNIYVVYLLLSLLLHYVSLTWIITSYRAVRYQTLELILGYCLVGGLFSALIVRAGKLFLPLKWAVTTIVIISAISVFNFNVQRIITGESEWGGPPSMPRLRAAEGVPPDISFDASEWYWFRNNNVEPVTSNTVSVVMNNGMRFIAVGDHEAPPEKVFRIPIDDTTNVKQVSRFYPKHVTYHKQITDYDMYYNRVENIYLSSIPPRLNHWIDHNFSYQEIKKPAPAKWRNIDILTIIPSQRSGRILTADIIIPGKFRGQVDVEIIGRWAPTRRHIHRVVYHVYNNGGKLWKGASTKYLISEDQIGRNVKIAIPIEDLFLKERCYKRMVNEIEIRFSVKTDKDEPERKAFVLIGNMRLI